MKWKRCPICGWNDWKTFHDMNAVETAECQECYWCETYIKLTENIGCPKCKGEIKKNWVRVWTAKLDHSWDEYHCDKCNIDVIVPKGMFN